MGSNSGFICFDGYLERTSKLSDQELGRLMRALMRYHAHGTEPNLKGREEVAFDFIREDIDSMDRKYAEKCEQNRRNRTGAASNDGERSTTIDNDRQRSSTNRNEPERSATNSDENPQIKTKTKTKTKNIFSDDDDDINAHARRDEWRHAAETGFIEHAGRRPTPEETSDLVASASLCGFSPEMVREAIRIAAANGAKNIAAYARRILSDWRINEVKTLEEAGEHKFLFDAWTGRNDFGKGDASDYERMEEARQRRKEEHATA